MKNKTIRILAVASAAALLLGGTYLLTRNDIAQRKAENELTSFEPSVAIQNALDYTVSDTTTDTDTSI